MQISLLESPPPHLAHLSPSHSPRNPFYSISASSSRASRRALLTLSATAPFLFFVSSLPASSSDSPSVANFFEIEGSGGVKAFEIRPGEGATPVDGGNPFYSISASSSRASRRALLTLSATAPFLFFVSSLPASSSDSPSVANFFEIEGSGGVKAFEIRPGEGATPVDGDMVAIHYYGRLAAKQGWRFDSTYDHKDETGDPVPFIFVLGSGKVISGIESAVKSMRVGSIRRIVIPPSLGYQNTSQEPIPPNFFDRQRLFTTIFNPTRLANGEGSTLGTLIFDIELVSIRHP